MKTIITLSIVAIVGVCIFTGCTVLPALVSVIDPSTPPQDWAQKAHFAKLMNHPKKQLLTEEEKKRAAKNICALKHLDKDKNHQLFVKESKNFCKLEQNDKIYFYDWCVDCGGGHSAATSYLLVRDGKPFESIQVERRWSEEERRTVPIVKRLH